MARQNIADAARVFELHVENLQEQQGLLGAKLRVTVTGPEERIESFRASLGGGGLVAGDPISAVIKRFD